MFFFCCFVCEFYVILQLFILILDVLTESVQELSPNVNQNQPNFNNTSQNPLDTNRDSIIISNLDILTSRDYLAQENISNVPSTNTGAVKNVHESSLLSTSNDTKNTPNKSIKRQSMSRPLSRKKSLIVPAITEYELDLLHLGDEEEMDKIFNKPGMKLERKNSKSLKATIGPVHAIWYNLITKNQ